MLITSCGFFSFVILAILVAWAVRTAVLEVRDPLLYLVTGGVLAFSLALAANPALNYLFPFDDSFYYLKTASNVSALGVPTFDGIHETNGWHPLWLCLLSALHKSLSPSLMGFITAAAILNWFLLLGSLALILVLMNGVLSRWAQVVALVSLANPWVTTRFWPSLMENVGTQFLLLLSLVLVRKIDSSKNYEPKLWIALACASSLLILFRLDMVLFVGLLGVCLVFLAYRQSGHLGSAIRRPALWGLAVSILPALYFVWNYVNFGHFSTVSSYAKVVLRGGSRTLLERYDSLCSLIATLPSLVPMPILRIASPVVLLVSLILAYYLLNAALSARARLTIGMLWGFAGLHFIAMKTMSVETFSWYYTAEILGAAVGVGVLATFVEMRFNLSPLVKWSMVSLALALNLALTFDALSGKPRFFHSNAIQICYGREFAKWIDANLPEEAVLGSWDAGVIGYFCSRNVVNLDGVINSFDYVEYMRRGAYREYVFDERIQYVVNYVRLRPDGNVKLPDRPGAKELSPILQLEQTGEPITPPFSKTPKVVYALFSVHQN